jgi:acetyl esterase/lipase
LRGKDLSRLPPAMVNTGEFDPLRDEGRAYAAALAHAGVLVQELHARGSTHSSISILRCGGFLASRYARGWPSRCKACSLLCRV